MIQRKDRTCEIKKMDEERIAPRYLVVCPNVLTATSEVIVSPFHHLKGGICGRELAE